VYLRHIHGRVPLTVPAVKNTMLLFSAAEDMFISTIRSVFRNGAEIGTFQKNNTAKIGIF